MVVDDVSDVTEMLSVLMTHAGYEVAYSFFRPGGDRPGQGKPIRHRDLGHWHARNEWL